MTSIVLQMEDNLNILTDERQIFGQMEDDLNILATGRLHQYFSK
jgi:hypothetical protein